VEGLRRSVAAVSERVRELETYAAEVRAADSALRAGDLRRSDDRYLDLLARTDDLSDLRTLTAQAAALITTLDADSASGLDAGSASGLDADSASGLDTAGAPGPRADNTSGPGAAGAAGPRTDSAPEGPATC
jgi:hypothetical protein